MGIDKLCQEWYNRGRADMKREILEMIEEKMSQNDNLSDENFPQYESLL